VATNSTAHLLPHLRRGQSVPDVGCGPGDDHPGPRRAHGSRTRFKLRTHSRVVPELTRPGVGRTTYREIAHRNGANPDAGRRLRSWERQAGITDIQITSSTWIYADPASCRWWGNGQDTRVEGIAFSVQVAEFGLGRTDVGAIADGWRRWGERPDACSSPRRATREGPVSRSPVGRTLNRNDHGGVGGCWATPAPVTCC
jgi:hypothetical protein